MNTETRKRTEPVRITHEEKIFLAILADRFGPKAVVETLPMAEEIANRGANVIK